MRKWMVILLIVFLCPLAARAELERTNWAWDTRLPDQGKVVANLWLSYETYGYSAVDVDGEYTNSSLSLSYGVRDNWSVSLEAGYSTAKVEGAGYSRSEDDFNDVNVATTYRILEEAGSGVDLAFRGRLRIPTAAQARFGSGHWEPKLEALMAKNLGPVLLVSNLGIRHIVNPDEGQKEFTTDGVLECVLPLGEQVSVSGFLTAGTMQWESSADAAYYAAGAGIRYYPAKTVYLSGTANRYLFREAYNGDWYLTLGMGIEF